MKKFFAMLMVLLMAISFAACGKKADPDTDNETKTSRLDQIMAAGKLVVATSPDYAPYEFKDPNKTGQDAVVGADIELAKYIAEKLGVTLVIEEMDFDSIVAAVQMGSIDLGISGFSYTEERAAMVNYSELYYQNAEGQKLLVAKGSEDQYQSAADFKGKKVAAQNGSLQYTLAVQNLPDAIIEPVTNINDAVLMLTTGKVDAVAIDGKNGAAILSNYEDSLAFATFEFELDDEGYGVLMQKEQDDLVDKINEIVKEVVDQDLYNSWLAAAMQLQKELGVE